jgi:sugar lactone lactonase YvrE
MEPATFCTRRVWLAASVQALAACAETPEAAGVAATRDTTGLGPPRVLIGGFLAPLPAGAPATAAPWPPRATGGAFVKLFTPTALALRGQVLLVADPGAGRLWRMDLGFNMLAGIAGAPAGPLPGAGPGLGLALGQDESAWVLEPGSARVLRFARDGRLLQTFRMAAQASHFALADSGATLLAAESGPAQWTEQRLVGGPAVTVRLQADEPRVGTADGIAVSGSDVLLLDRAQGVVHRVRRDGRLVRSLGRGLFRQPQALAVDAFDRIWVTDAFGPQLHVLWPDGRTRTLEAAALRLQQLGGLALDERSLALSDRLSGQVLMFALPGAAW